MIKGRDPDVVGCTELGRAILERQMREGPPVDHVPKVMPDRIIGDEPFDLSGWGIAGKLIYTPGHSRGCISLVLEDGEAVVGDRFASPEGAPPCPAFFTYPGGDSQEVYRSLELLLNMGVHTFYSGHGGCFSRDDVTDAIRHERQS